MHIFMLKPSLIPEAGVGVFATADIAAGVKLPELFSEDSRNLTLEEFQQLDVPESVKLNFSIPYATSWWVPQDFNKLCIGWYLNHSDEPNLAHDDNYEYYTLRTIAPGEELTIDYDLL